MEELRLVRQTWQLYRRPLSGHGTRPADRQLLRRRRTCGIQTSRVRTFCCEPSEDPLFLPVPLGNLFQHPPEGDSVDTYFTLRIDKDSDSQQEPNGATFQSVVLASLEERQVSLDKRDGSHCDIFSGCDSAVGEEGPHTAQMVCTYFSEGSNCHKRRLG